MSDFTASDPSIGLRPASQIVARPVSWLWPGRLPLGKLAIFDGDPGVGKSLTTLDLCARPRKASRILSSTPLPKCRTPSDATRSIDERP